MDRGSDEASQRETIAADPAPLDSAPAAEVTPSDGDATPAVPARIGRFVPIACVGRGGMGVVWSAYDPQLDRKVAIKLIAAAGEGTHGARAADRMLREARALARLTHPNVVAVYDVGTQDEALYIAMEFVEGETLDHALATPRSWREVLALFEPAGRGLAAAHAAGLVHRDVKPSNIVVARDRRVVVLDFGLARAPVLATFEAAAATGLDPRATEGGALLGTPAYMSPEQWRGLAVDARSDQFNFCVALWEALVGEHPFDRTSTLTLAQSVTTGAVRSPPAGGRVSKRVLAIVRRGLAVDPEQRWPSMPALLEALARAQARPARLFAAAGVATLGIVAAAAWPSASPAIDRCAAPAERIAAVWTDARRGALAAAFAAVGRGFATDAWSRVEPALDAYARAWTASATDACTAAGDGVSGEQAALQIACHGDALHRFDALVERLAHAEGESIARATDAVANLPALDRCADVGRLRAANPEARPDDAQAGVLRTQLAQLEAAIDVADHATALALAPTLEAAVEELADPGLRALALRGLSMVARVQGRPDAAVADLDEAAALAMSSGRDELFAQLAADLAAELVLTGGSSEAAGAWWRVATAAGERVTLGAAVAVQALRTGSLIAVTQHELQRGAELAAEAESLARTRLGDTHVITLRARSDAARVATLRGDYGAALQTYGALVVASRETYGPRHPNTLDLEGSEIAARLEAGLRDGVVARAQALLAEYGPGDAGVLWAQVSLAGALAGEGRWDEADAAFAEAHAALVADLEASYFASGLSCERARVLQAAGRSEDAWRMAQRCEAEIRGSHADHEGGAFAFTSALVDVAQSAVLTGHHDDAERLLAEIAEGFAHADSEDESEAIAMLVGAELAIARGDLARGETAANAAVIWLEVHGRTHARSYVEALAVASDTARLVGARATAASRAQQALATAQARPSTHPLAVRRAWVAVAAAAIDAGDRARADEALATVRTMGTTAPVDPELDLRARWEELRATGRAADERAAMRGAASGRSPLLRAVIDAG